MAPSLNNPPPAQIVRDRVAAHYDRRAARTVGALSTMNRVWADKARAGHTNAFVRRVERMAVSA